MKYIGLDLGSVTCGISVSETGLIAQSVETLRFPKDDYDIAIDMVKKVIEREKPDLIVLGYPLLENGDVSTRAMISEDFAKYLHEETGIEVYLQDERNTTQESEAILLEADLSRKKRKKIIDQVAAARILQYYLDNKNQKAG